MNIHYFLGEVFNNFIRLLCILALSKLISVIGFSELMMLNLIYGILPYIINLETSNDVVRRCRKFMQNKKIEGLLVRYSFSFFLQRFLITILIVFLFIKINKLQLSFDEMLILSLSIVCASIIIDLSRIFLLRSHLMLGLKLNAVIFTLPLVIITFVCFFMPENTIMKIYVYSFLLSNVTICFFTMRVCDVKHGLKNQSIFDIKRFKRVRSSFFANLIDTFMPIFERSAMLYFGGASLIATISILNISVLSTKVIITSLLVNPIVGFALAGNNTHMTFKRVTIFIAAVFIGIITTWALRVFDFHQVSYHIIIISVVLVAFGAMSSVPHYKLLGEGAYIHLFTVSFIAAIFVIIFICNVAFFSYTNLIIGAFLYGFLLFVFKHIVCFVKKNIKHI